MMPGDLGNKGGIVSTQPRIERRIITKSTANGDDLV